MSYLWEDWVNAEGFKNKTPPWELIAMWAVEAYWTLNLVTYQNAWNKGVLNDVSSVTNNLTIHNQNQSYFFQFRFSLRSKNNI